MPATIVRGELIAFLQDLVRASSQYLPDAGRSEAPAAELIVRQMRSWGWEPEVWEVEPGRPNVVATIDGGRPGGTLLLEGHTDVVSEGDSSKWAHPPYGGEIVEGRLYGRGSADMKGGVAAMLFAARALYLARPFPGRVVVAALVDEEGMMIGVKDFVASGRARGLDAAIICEPEEREVCIAQKGAIRVRVTSWGRMAHGAMPQHGLNPIPPLVAFVQRAAELQEELQHANGEHPYVGWDYITPTVVVANRPEQLNVIPDRAFVWLDIRTTPATDHAELLARLRSILGQNLELDVIDDRPSTETAKDHPLVRAVVEAHKAVYGETPAFGGVPGSTDGTILWRDAGIPIVTYGPGGKWIAHQVDEYVEVEEVVRAAEVYVEAARRFLSLGIESSSKRV
ncbi:MAG: M20 family metallopeptidase [Candidatus Dormibacteraceae bacterium]